MTISAERPVTRIFLPVFKGVYIRGAWEELSPRLNEVQDKPSVDASAKKIKEWVSKNKGILFEKIDLKEMPEEIRELLLAGSQKR